MKYVRTKDGKIVKVNLEGDVFTSKYEIVGEPKDTYLKKKIIKLYGIMVVIFTLTIKIIILNVLKYQ